MSAEPVAGAPRPGTPPAVGSPPPPPPAPPRVTVITPAYNIEPYVAEAMTAVLAQTVADFEYLVVDDGSQDRTADIARELARSDARIRVVEGDHAGSAAARNLALTVARGTYVAFCDGDDRWDPQFLERSLATLESAPPEVGAVFSAFRHIDERGRRGLTARYAEPGDYDAERMLAGSCPPGNGSCLVLRRSCFAEAGLFDEDLDSCIDLDMWMRIQLDSQTPLFRFLPEVLVEWRRRPGSISSDDGKRVDGLAEMLRRYGAVLSRRSRGAAHIWPAVMAFTAGRDHTGRTWLQVVRRDEPWFFVRGRNGFALSVFAILGPRWGRALQRVAARGASLVARLPTRLLPTRLLRGHPVRAVSDPPASLVSVTGAAPPGPRG